MILSAVLIDDYTPQMTHPLSTKATYLIAAIACMNVRVLASEVGVVCSPVSPVIR